jgi:DHA1 family multidrug resistance protein-like MFS transporter
MMNRGKLGLFVMISAMGLLGRLSYEMLRSPVTPIYATRLGAPPQLVGLIVAAATITGIFLKMPSGVLGDVVGFRRLMSAGTVPKAFGPFLYILVRSPLGLFLARLFHGLSTALYAPPAAALVAKLFPTQRGRFLGLYSAAENAGVVLGPVVGGAVLADAGFTRTFVVSGLIGIPTFIIGLMLLAREVPEDQPAPERRSLPDIRRGLAEIARDRTIRLTALAEGSLYFAYGSLQAFLPLYAASRGIDPATIGLIFGAQGVTSLLSRPYLGRWSDRIGRRPVIVGGLCVAAFVLLAVPWQSRAWSLLALGALFGVATGAVTPASNALISDVARAGRLGAALGMFGSLWDLGHALGPVVSGILRGWLSYQVVFSAIGAMVVGALVTFGLAVHEPERSAAAGAGRAG